MNLTNKQFLISNKQFNIADMSVTALSNAFLYTDNTLNVFVEKGVILLGNAFVADKENTTVQDNITAWNGKSVNELTYNWTGKWVLINDNEIISDPAGLMPVFYYVENDCFLISSSLCLISKLTGKKPYKSVLGNSTISWQLLPYTIIENVMKLLPLQKIVMAKSGIEIKNNNWVKSYKHASTEEKVKELAYLLTTSIKNIYKFSGRQIYATLTGGNDSRVTLSAILAAGIKNFNVYTFKHANMISADKTVPKKIAKDFGLNYLFIKGDKLDRKRAEAYAAFTAGNTHDADELFYAEKQFDKIPDNAIVLKSAIYEIGTLCYNPPAPDVHLFMELSCKEYNEDNAQINAYEKWLQYIGKTPLDDIDFRYRFYLEQRVAGWASAIEQSYDINNFVSLQIADNAHIISLLLSATSEERKAKVFTRNVIGLLEPKLLNYPINKITVFDYLIFAKNKLKSWIKK